MGPAPVDKLKNQEIDIELENECENDTDDAVLETKPSEKYYQEDKPILKLLPHYEQLMVETDKYFKKILEDLVHAVETKDLYFGLSQSTSQLTWYIRELGRRFSKDKHIHLVRLYIGLLTMESCPERIIPTLCDIIQLLLKKRRLLPKEDLIIPWRPLYKIFYFYAYKLNKGVNSHAPTLNKLIEGIKACNQYFGKDAFQEVLDEVSPLLFPANSKMGVGLQLLNCFLPFNEPDVLPELTKLMERLFSIWDIWSSNCSHWQDRMFNLIKTISLWFRGFDWSPYMTHIFTRFGRILISYKNKCETEQEAFLDQMSIWTIGVLGNNKSALRDFRDFVFYFSKDTIECIPGFFPKIVGALTSRVLKERYVSKEKRIGGTHLTDEDIEFVTKLIFEICTEYYVDSCTGSKILRDLAYLNPKLVIPTVLEKYSLSIDRVEESERFTVVLDWIEQIMTPFITWEEAYRSEEKWSGVVKLAYSQIPAIGPNDLCKTNLILSTFRVIFQRIPMIDCSDLATSTPGMEYHWKKFCLETKGFEELCSKFTDKVFELIEVSRYENISVIDNPDHIPTFDREDDDLSTKLWNTFHPLAINSSVQICTMLSKKIVDFAFTNILETHYSGILFAAVYEAFVNARPEITVPMALPRLLDSLKKLILEGSEGELSPELDFLLILLEKTLLCSGEILLSYKDSLNELIPLILTLEVEKIQSLLCNTVTKILYSLCSIYPLDVKILPKNKIGHLPHPKEWMTKYNINTDPIEVDYHIPTTSELSWANDLFLKVFTKYSDFIQEQIHLMKEENRRVSPLERQKLANAIWKLNAAFEGISCAIAKESSVGSGKVVIIPNQRYNHHEWTQPICQKGEMFRHHYFELICSLLDSLNKYRSDDTEASNLLAGSLLSINDHSWYISYDQHERSSYFSYTTGDSPLDPAFKAFRPYFVIQAACKYGHISRMKCEGGVSWTPFSEAIFGKFLELANNQYQCVRIKAQRNLRYFSEPFSNVAIGSTAKKMFERIHADTPEHEVKGTLHTILDLKQRLIHETTWENIYNFWKIVLNAPFSEKEHVKRVQDDIINEVYCSFLWFPSEEDIQIPDSVLDVGHLLCKTVSNTKSQNQMSEMDVQNSSNHKRWYDLLVQMLLEIGSSKSWYVKLRVCKIMGKLITRKVSITERMIEFFYDITLDDNMDLRTEAVNTLKTLSILFKREIPISRTINTDAFLKEECFESFYDFFMYKTESKSNRSNFYIHSGHYGFYSIPKELNFKDEIENFSLEEQPNQIQQFCGISVSFFKDPAFVQAFLEIHSSDSIENLQESMRTYFGAFTRSNGPNALNVLMEEMSKLLQLGTQHLDKEKLFLVINILVGILKGIKYWSQEIISNFWEESLKPILLKCRENVTEETELCWEIIGTTVLHNRDPYKYHFFIEFLYEKYRGSIHNSSVSCFEPFIDLNTFSGALYVLFWRVILYNDELYETFFEFVFKRPSPFENVRWNIAYILGCMKNTQEYIRRNGEVRARMLESCVKNIPKMNELVLDLTERFAGLYSDSTNAFFNEMSKENRELLLSFKTVLEWIRSMCIFEHPDVYQFLPLLCQFVNFNQDVGIEEKCDSIISTLGNIEISLDTTVDTILTKCNEISKMDSWRSRFALVNYLGSVITCNLHIVRDERYSEAFLALILELAYDTNTDVRGLAAGYFCYFIRFSILKNPMELFEKFKNEVLSLKSKANARKYVSIEDRARSWHAAISGLTAFVYANEGKETMPDYLPGLMIFLTEQLTDVSPEQVRTEVRNALQFFRQHYQEDNWVEHKNKFTEEQIRVLRSAVVNSTYHV